ncbi:RNA polymerase sigma-70 factor [Pedobacter sp. HDW13]|uniref:RNA polymerase sigma factor n=1 Tax=unclassified Pedobacter TaxID=2628915 RepID=UPI000F5B7553|nr:MULTISPECIES: RNA polymerase sigma-70 factor [unclassified Pedobacter]QIL37835.1 RNA polymerase sigma-70 factor [Pedobacter sp. HDW13]RQO78994.1 RNA polymerase subunit sigma-70 [Pedobacter sp. KBW01]
MDIYRDYSDQELCSLLKEGDRPAYIEIYKRYNSLLFLYAYKKLRNREEAKDAVQEVFIQLWNRHLHLSFNSSLAGYLYQSVRNRALNIFAHQQIEQKYIDSLNDFLGTHASDTDYLIREKEIAALIDNEINALPPKMRQVFLLSRKEHKTYKEIAAEMNISEDTVNTQMKRALKTMRDKLGPLFILLGFFY